MRKTAFMAALLACCLGAAAGDAGRVDRMRVGDWALYRLMGSDDVVQLHRVQSISGEGDDAVITFEYIDFASGRETGRSSAFQTAGELRAAESGTEAEPARSETLAFKDGAMRVEVSETVEEDVVVTYYGSDQVPVHGIVRVETSSLPFPVTELLDYGAADRPPPVPAFRAEADEPGA